MLFQPAGEVDGASNVVFGVFALENVDSVAFRDMGQER